MSKSNASKFRAWCFTINNWTEKDVQSVNELDSEYTVYSEEFAPTTGTPHLQGYAYFKSPRSMSGLSKLIPRASLRVANGSSLENRVYIIGPYTGSDGKFKPYNEKHKEIGKLPKQGARNDLAVVRQLVDDGNTMRDIVDVATSYQSIRSAEIILKYKEQKRDWKPHVTWIYGKSGTGKTRWAYDNHPPEDIHKQPASEPKWFEGYDAHPVVIIDEVDFAVNYPLLKELTDRYPMKVHNKGGMRSFLAKFIILTSLTHPAELFYDYPENGKEMLRRIDEIISL